MNINKDSWSAVWLVASRELSIRLRSKAYMIGTTGILLLIVAATVVLTFVGRSGSDGTIGYTDRTASLATSLETSAKALGHTVSTTEVATEADGRAKVNDSTLDALLVGDGTGIDVVVKKDLDPNLRQVLTVLAGQLALNQQITTLGGDPARVNTAMATASVTVEPLEQPFPYDVQQVVLGILAGAVVYISLMLNGQGVAQGVVEEKTSRVVELLLATIRPWQLMAGKVLGIGAFGLLQTLAIGVVGIVSGLLTGVLTISVSAAASTVIWLVVWFLLGFTMYSIIFAGLGALVSRQEDVGGVVTPALLLVIAGFVMGSSILPADPGNTLVEVLSIIPMFAPTLMPMRLAMGGVPVWEAILSLALVALLVPALIWLSGRIYRNAVLHTGAKVQLRHALRAG